MTRNILSDFQSILNCVFSFFNDWCAIFSEAVYLLLDCRLFAFTVCFGNGCRECDFVDIIKSCHCSIGSGFSSLDSKKPRVGSGHCRISPPRFLAECCKRPGNWTRVVLFCCILGCLLFLICIEFVYLYFPVLCCLSVSIKWLAVKIASEMTYTVSSGALNSTPTKPSGNGNDTETDMGWVHPWVRLGWVGSHFPARVMGWVSWVEWEVLLFFNCILCLL